MAEHNNELDILDLDDLLSESDSEEENNNTQEPDSEAKAPDAAKAFTSEETRSAAKPASKEEIPAAAKPEPNESDADDTSDALEIDFIDVAAPKSPQQNRPQKRVQSDSKRSEEEQADRKKPAASKRPAQDVPGEQRKPASGRPAQRRTARQEQPPRRRPQPENDEDDKQPFPLHLALLAAIVVLAVIAVVRFLVWNKGVELKVRIGENKDKYIIEVNDNMVYLSDSKLEGHEDDGVTTILCLGNEPFSQDTSESGLAGQIASLGGCTVINAAFPGSQVTCENAQYRTDSLDSMDDIFNLFYVSYAISIGDFSSLETVASAHTEDSAYQQSVDALKSTDFSKVDIIAIMYDGTDYINGMAMQNPDVPDELTTYVGSLSNSFKLLQDKYPYIRIVFMSPYYAEYDGVNSRTTDLGNGTIVNYFQWAYDTCGSSSVSFLDNYYGSVNENNYKDYLSDDVHLNAAGCTKVADHFVYKVIQDNYAEYNVSSMAVAQGS